MDWRRRWVGVFVFRSVTLGYSHKSSYPEEWSVPKQPREDGGALLPADSRDENCEEMC